MGGIAFHDLSAACIEAAQVCSSITVIGSGVRAINILKAIKTLGADRVCFGSDTPFAMMRVELAMYAALMKDQVVGEDRDLVLGGNIARLFGIEEYREEVQRVLNENHAGIEKILIILCLSWMRA